MQSPWSDTGRGKDEGKRTLLAQEKSVFLSHQGEGGHRNSFPSDSGSGCFSFMAWGTVAQHKSNLISLFDTEQQTVMSIFLSPGGGDSRLLVTFTVLSSRLVC